MGSVFLVICLRIPSPASLLLRKPGQAGSNKTNEASTNHNRNNPHIFPKSRRFKGSVALCSLAASASPLGLEIDGRRERQQVEWICSGSLRGKGLVQLRGLGQPLWDRNSRQQMRKSLPNQYPKCSLDKWAKQCGEGEIWSTTQPRALLAAIPFSGPSAHRMATGFWYLLCKTGALLLLLQLTCKWFWGCVSLYDCEH